VHWSVSLPIQPHKHVADKKKNIAHHLSSQILTFLTIKKSLTALCAVTVAKTRGELILRGKNFGKMATTLVNRNIICLMRLQ
jgi:hypothetical protein